MGPTIRTIDCKYSSFCSSSIPTPHDHDGYSHVISCTTPLLLAVAIREQIGGLIPLLTAHVQKEYWPHHKVKIYHTAPNSLHPSASAHSPAASSSPPTNPNIPFAHPRSSIIIPSPSRAHHLGLHSSNCSCGLVSAPHSSCYLRIDSQSPLPSAFSPSDITSFPPPSFSSCGAPPKNHHGQCYKYT